jgi:mannose-6-phosphate isomerase-like protein (cupin superfamily)
VIYVLSGRMRLVLADQDWVPGPGEVAEFDTKVPPHWFERTGEGPAEIISILGRLGERMRTRTAPTPHSAK